MHHHLYELIMSNREKPKRPVKSLETTLEILEEIVQKERVSITSLADSLDMSVSSIHSHLSTLAHKDYVVKENGTYRLGSPFLHFGHYVRDTYTIYPHVAPSMDAISDQTGFVTCFAIIEHNFGVYIDVAFTDPSIHSQAHPGYRYRPYTAASGKAILAKLPEERVREIMRYHGFESLTENTISDIDELFEELSEIRDQGYAVSTGEKVVGRTGIATPIVYESDVYGALAIAGPSSDSFTHQIDDMIGLLESHVSNIQLKLHKESSESPAGIDPHRHKAIR